MILTTTQLLIMIGVHILGDDSTGVKVANLIINTTHNHQPFKQSIYTHLHRLRDRGLLQQWVAGDDSPRPFYSITPAGLTAIRATLREVEAMVSTARTLRKELFDGEARSNHRHGSGVHQGQSYGTGNR